MAGQGHNRGGNGGGAPFVDACTLPEQYHHTHLNLLARDPHWIHAYWEITPESLESIKNQLGEEFHQSVITLRMYDITSVDFNGFNANHSFDIDVGPDARNWYINLWCDNVAYCADLGVRTPWGRFFPLTRSNAVVTPREAMSDRREMIWMKVHPGRRERPFVMTEKDTQKKVAALEAISCAVKRKAGRKFYLTEEDIRAYYAKLFPALKRLRRRRRPAKRPEETLTSTLHRLGLVPVEESVIPGLYSDRYKILMKAGASAELLREGGGSEAIFSGASEGQQSLRQRKFFFEIWADLIVYGRTEADAEVKLGTKIIPLRPDGTFTLRYALPDLNIPFDFTATSHDREETRRITTAVERFKTVYNP